MESWKISISEQAEAAIYRLISRNLTVEAEEPIRDERGRIVAPAQANTLPERPRGPWNKNHWGVLGLILGVVFLNAIPASAQSVKAAKAATIFSTAAQAGDLVSTLRVPDWETRELNGLIRGGNKGLVLTKLTVATFNAVGSLKAAKKHPKVVFYLQLAVGSGLTYVTYRNTRNRS